jgi:hypothetical protein
MTAHLTAARAVLAAVEPPPGTTTGMLQRGLDLSMLHLDAGCHSAWVGGAPGRSTDLRKLLEDVPTGEEFRVCHVCVQREPSQNVLRMAWKTQLWAVVEIYDQAARARALAARQHVAEPHGYAKGLVRLALVFDEVAAQHHFAAYGYTTWSHPELQELAEREWDAGKEAFTSAASASVVTRHLSTHRHVPADEFAVVPRATDLGQREDTSQGQWELLMYAALLEAPRLGQSTYWFLAPATWPSGRKPAALVTIPTIAVHHRGAYTTALELWQDTYDNDLHDLIVSVDKASAP